MAGASTPGVAVAVAVGDVPADAGALAAASEVGPEVAGGGWVRRCGVYEDGLGWPQATANAARAQSSANKMGRRKTTVRRLTCLRGLENETRTTTRSIRHVQTVYLHVGQNDQSRLQHGDQPVEINTHQRIIIQKIINKLI